MVVDGEAVLEPVLAEKEKVEKGFGASVAVVASGLAVPPKVSVDFTSLFTSLFTSSFFAVAVLPNVNAGFTSPFTSSFFAVAVPPNENAGFTVASLDAVAGPAPNPTVGFTSAFVSVDVVAPSPPALGVLPNWNVGLNTGFAALPLTLPTPPRLVSHAQHLTASFSFRTMHVLHSQLPSFPLNRSAIDALVTSLFSSSFTTTAFSSVFFGVASVLSHASTATSNALLNSLASSSFANRTANISASGGPSLMSAAVCHIHALLPYPGNSVSDIPLTTRWFKQIFSVWSRRISTRTLPLFRCFSSFTSPVPRSFHDLAVRSYRYDLARSVTTASSSSSIVFTSTSGSDTSA